MRSHTTASAYPALTNLAAPATTLDAITWTIPGKQGQLLPRVIAKLGQPGIATLTASPPAAFNAQVIDFLS